jgi:hypothetical protein
MLASWFVPAAISIAAGFAETLREKSMKQRTLAHLPHPRVSRRVALEAGALGLVSLGRIRTPTGISGSRLPLADRRCGQL